MKTENIQRIKETCLVLFFFVFLFSFTNKSFGKTNEIQKEKKTTVSIFKNSDATFSNNQDFQVCPQNRLISSIQLWVPGLTPKIQNNKINTEISLFLKNNLQVKPPVPCRIYYRLFSLKSEEFPSLG